MLKIYNKEEFLHRICCLSGIVLFGAGKRLSEVECFFENPEISSIVSGVVDNNVKKQGTTVRIWGKTYEIYSFEKAIEDEFRNKMILITLEDYSDLLDDLLEEKRLKDAEIVCFSHIIALQKEAKSINKSVPDIFRLEENPLIPKKIHYCWFGGKPLPDKYKRYMESWHKFCPNYEIVEWNESNYDVSKCKYMREAYEKRMFGFVSDYARMDIVYNNGGIYLDTDVELVKNIDDLLYQKGFAGFEDENYVNLGCGFGAVKDFPILKAMIEHYDDKHFIDLNGELDLTPIPIHNNIVLLKYGLINNGEYQRVADMTIYPAKVLAGKCMYTMRTVIKPWTYAIHHYDGSWATERARRINARMERDMKLYHADRQDEE
ncbi:MAG TPA: hypothetical protein DDY31_14020 [Lachnospiraceae bacterium]|nr:hypothetical protein [Lachnospiraceae bacterium]